MNYLYVLWYIVKFVSCKEINAILCCYIYTVISKL